MVEFRLNVYQKGAVMNNIIQMLFLICLYGCTTVKPNNEYSQLIENFEGPALEVVKQHLRDHSPQYEPMKKKWRVVDAGDYWLISFADARLEEQGLIKIGGGQPVYNVNKKTNKIISIFAAQ